MSSRVGPPCYRANVDAVLRIGSGAAVVAGAIEEAAGAASGGGTLFLVPNETRRAELRAAWLDALARRGKGGAFEAPFATPGGAVAALHARLPGARRIATALERRVLLEHATSAALVHPGLVERTARFIQELGEAGIFVPEDLGAARAARVPPALAGALAAYARALEERGLTDPERAAAAVATALERGALRGPRLLVIDGLSREGAVRRRLLRALARRAARTIAIFDAPGADAATLGAAPISLCGGPLEAIAGAVDFCLDSQSGLGARLEIVGAPAAAAPPIFAFAARTRAAEVERIARHVRAILDGAAGPASPPPRIAVVFPALDAYAPIVRELFPRHGIPFRLARGQPLAGSPVVRALFDLVEAARSGFERGAVARAFLSPYVAFPGLDYGRVDRAAREAELRGPIGRRGSRARLDAPALDEAFATLEALDRSAPPAEHERALVALLRRSGISRRLLEGPEPEIVARDAAAERALVAAVRGVARALGGERPEAVPFARFFAMLRAAVGTETLPPEERGPVLVLSPREARGLGADHLFFGGLAADEFPSPREADVFLSDEDRRALGLATARDRILEARWLLACALGGARRSATLSYFQDGLEGRANASPLFPADAPAPPWTCAGGPVAPHAVAAWIGGALARPRAEVDLGAVVAALARGPARPALLIRGVRAALERTERPEPGPFEGVLDGAALARLSEEARRPLTPTYLERYAACPFRAFAERHLGLAPLPEPDEDQDAREQGELIHRILSRFYDGFARGPGEAWLARAVPRMRAIAEEELGRVAREDAFVRARRARLLAGLEGPGREAAPVRGPLRAFLEREAAGGARFGVEVREQRVALEVDGALVEGVVDRVDVGEDGFVIYDYKTGKRPPSVRAVLEGRSFQLPFYALATARALGDGAHPLGAAYYQVPASGDPATSQRWFAAADAFGARAPLGTRPRGSGGVLDRFGEALARAPASIGAALASIRAGIFHPGWLPPEEKGCRHCDAARICRADHARLAAAAAREAPSLFRPLPLLPS